MLLYFLPSTQLFFKPNNGFPSHSSAAKNLIFKSFLLISSSKCKLNSSSLVFILPLCSYLVVIFFVQIEKYLSSSYLSELVCLRLLMYLRYDPFQFELFNCSSQFNLYLYHKNLPVIVLFLIHELGNK